MTIDLERTHDDITIVCPYHSGVKARIGGIESVQCKRGEEIVNIWRAIDMKLPSRIFYFALIPILVVLFGTLFTVTARSYLAYNDKLVIISTHLVSIQKDIDYLTNKEQEHHTGLQHKSGSR